MVISRALPINDGTASPEEAALAIAALSDADLARLGRVARLRAHGLRDTDWEDLLHEAVSRTLDGSRRWPVRIPLTVFLREVIRSLASEARRRSLPALGQWQEDLDEVANLVCEEPGAERTAVARNLVEIVGRLFAGDGVALGIIDAVGEGLSPNEIQQRLGLKSTEYESARRRIRRKLATLPPEAV